jgi:hypothetical protein
MPQPPIAKRLAASATEPVKRVCLWFHQQWRCRGKPRAVEVRRQPAQQAEPAAPGATKRVQRFVDRLRIAAQHARSLSGSFRLAKSKTLGAKRPKSPGCGAGKFHGLARIVVELRHHGIRQRRGGMNPVIGKQAFLQKPSGQAAHRCRDRRSGNPSRRYSGPLLPGGRCRCEPVPRMATAPSLSPKAPCSAISPSDSMSAFAQTAGVRNHIVHRIADIVAGKAEAGRKTRRFRREQCRLRRMQLWRHRQY